MAQFRSQDLRPATPSWTKTRSVASMPKISRWYTTSQQDSGITFFELTKALGDYEVRREQLQAVADGVYQMATIMEDGKLYRLVHCCIRRRSRM
jgi:hypothetical protein